METEKTLATELDPVKHLEPVALDPEKVAKKALDQAKGDLDTAREMAQEIIKDTSDTSIHRS